MAIQHPPCNFLVDGLHTSVRILSSQSASNQQTHGRIGIKHHLNALSDGLASINLCHLRIDDFNPPVVQLWTWFGDGGVPQGLWRVVRHGIIVPDFRRFENCVSCTLDILVRALAKKCTTNARMVKRNTVRSDGVFWIKTDMNVHPTCDRRSGGRLRP